MEIPGHDQVCLQSFIRTPTVTLTPGASSEPQQEQQDESETEPESSRETPKPNSSHPPLVLVQLRIQQLCNRRLVLQHFRNKEGSDGDGTTEEMTCENSDEVCELEAIQKELEELLVKKKELAKQGKSSNHTQEGQNDARPTFYKTKTPRGGIYTLPPPQLKQEDITLQQGAGTPTGPVVPVDKLDRMSAITQCPSCEQVVFTETYSTMSEAMWQMCCLCSVMGCVAGCCLIPFFMDRFRNVHHKCSLCQAHIHTYRPF
ncbi:uncharacterized protein LOC121175620 [Toxotes jaculatrix]|uniref:uncharacterized protein LOC121175620 n=1 Tax=Toxotes jaculatrix TaxID=941984 RepID=UPI001B3A8145|nr:uncharacterized protein LOC121175620 [Toxotes jaculatrix]